MNSKPKAHSSRDLFGGGNGKGDKSRVTDVKKYQDNYDLIDWGNAPVPQVLVDAAAAESDKTVEHWPEPPTP